MRLVLTRAAADAARTCEKLEQAGHRVIKSPVIEIVATRALWPTGIVDAIVASSAHAFLAPPDGLLPECRRVLPLFLVGDRTGEAARAARFAGHQATAKTADALVSLIQRLQLPLRRVVYLAGRDRKADLERALEAMNLLTEVVEAYAAQATDRPTTEAIQAFRQDAVDGILHFSRRSAELFLAAAKQAGLELRRVTHFCLSEDVATPFREAGCPAIGVAKTPTEAELLTLVNAT